jgi:PD-(D/E)XK nuclease superfamily protein
MSRSAPARPRGGPGCSRRPRADGRRLSAKQRGELAELAFLYRAAALGLGVLKPMGDSLPYDAAVDNGRCLLRVQVKSVGRPRRNLYQIHTVHGIDPKKPYTREQVDFLAAYVVSEELWLIVPVEVFAGRCAIYVPMKGPRYRQYREAWHLLQAAQSPPTSQRTRRMGHPAYHKGGTGSSRKSGPGPPGLER